MNKIIRVYRLTTAEHASLPSAHYGKLSAGALAAHFFTKSDLAVIYLIGDSTTRSSVFLSIWGCWMLCILGGAVRGSGTHARYRDFRRALFAALMALILLLGTVSGAADVGASVAGPH